MCSTDDPILELIEYHSIFATAGRTTEDWMEVKRRVQIYSDSFNRVGYIKWEPSVRDKRRGSRT